MKRRIAAVLGASASPPRASAVERLTVTPIVSVP